MRALIAIALLKRVYSSAGHTQLFNVAREVESLVRAELDERVAGMAVEELDCAKKRA